MQRILSGITPSSTKGLHLGNYLGAVKPHIEYQETHQCFYFVANNHSLNTVFNSDEVRKNTLNIFVEYLAFGIDPEKTTFFVEGDIPAIFYLQSILNNVVTISELKRMHAYKDKLQKDIEPDTISMGLFSYPVLMSADILIFEPDIVPVGEDQAQHVEICREIARTFNNRYGEILKIPELSIKKDTARVPGIYGDRKMSKSLGNDLPIFAPVEEVKKQVMSIKTDPSRIHPTDPGDPAKNLTFTYFELLGFDDQKLEEYKEAYRKGTISDVEIKKGFLTFFLEHFNEARERKRNLLKNTDKLHEIRETGAKKANGIAQKTLEKVKKAVGL